VSYNEDYVIYGRRPVLIAGPTASGKSELAMRIAERDDGCVINADALQVYDCWRVLSARPSEADCARVPHALYGTVDARTRHSVGAWLRDVAALLERLAACGQRPVIVGGTGLYLSALTEGLAEIPEIDPEVRADSQRRIDSGLLSGMLSELAARDHRTYGRMDRANPVRVQRAWEVLVSTGRPLSSWQDETPPPLLPRAACDAIVLSPEIPVQHRAVEARFRRMVPEGALAECRAFLAAGTPRDLPSARALGAEQLFAHLDGAIDLETAILEAVIATRQFSKRQRSWFRGRMADWRWLSPGTDDLLAAVPPDRPLAQ